MVSFELVEKDDFKYFKVIFSGKNIGMISAEGILCFQAVSNVGHIKSDALEIIKKKVFEVERFGFIVCKKCDGSPMFPNMETHGRHTHFCKEFIHPRL